jgi:hypothetical protein
MNKTNMKPIKIIDNRPKPEPINLDWLMKTPKMDFMSKFMTWFCCGAWLLILLAIFFS